MSPDLIDGPWISLQFAEKISEAHVAFTKGLDELGSRRSGSWLAGKRCWTRGAAGAGSHSQHFLGEGYKGKADDLN